MKTLNGHYHKIGFPSNVLTFPSKNSVQHSLYQNMKFLAIELSGRYYETQVFYQKMLTLLIHIKNWYELVFRRWAVYATSRNSDPYITDVNTILSFLHGLFLNGIYLFIYLLIYLFIYWHIINDTLQMHSEFFRNALYYFEIRKSLTYINRSWKTIPQ